jgi:hypothetical protein
VARSIRFDARFNTGQGDYDFFLTLVKNGYRGVRVPGARLEYRIHAGSISHAVRHGRRQRAIARKIIRKHSDFISTAEAKAALAEADNRLLISLITSRSPFAGIGSRVRDWALFSRVGLRHAEWRRQLYYTIRPRSYFGGTFQGCDIFMLFRDTESRRLMVRRVESGAQAGLGREQLHGYDELQLSGLSANCNLHHSRVESGGLLRD